MKIALAQVSATPQLEKNLKKASDFIKSASKQQAEIICFPEMSFSRFFPQFYCDPEYFKLAEKIPGGTTDFLCKLASENNINIISNLFENAGKGVFYNSSPVIDNKGEIVDVIRMMHIAEEPLFNEKYYYHPAPGCIRVIELNECKIGIAICYDRHYPELMRSLALQGADIVFIPQAGTIGNPIQLYQMEMQAFSFQNQIFTALVNRTGEEDKMTFAGSSFVTAPDGTVDAMAGSDIKDELLIYECDLDLIGKMRIDRPFLRDRRPELY